MDNSGDLYPFVERTTLRRRHGRRRGSEVDRPVIPCFDCSTAGYDRCSGRPVHRGYYFGASSEPIRSAVVLVGAAGTDRNITLEVNYVGNKGTHLLDRTNIYQPFAASNPALCQADPTAGDCPIGDRRPYANFSAFATLDSHWDGYSNYNAGNVKLERRATHMAFTAVYTWAKSLDDKSAAAGIGATNGFAGHMNDHNPRADYGPSDFNVGQRFVGSIVYGLPVGREKKYLGKVEPSR